MGAQSFLGKTAWGAYCFHFTHNKLLSEHAESQGLASDSHLSLKPTDVGEISYNCKRNPPKS